MNSTDTHQFRINDFFDNYAEGIEKQDTKMVANCFALPCSFLADDTSSVYTTLAKLEGLINQGKRFFGIHKITDVRADIRNKRQITPKITRVHLNWQYRNDKGGLVYECDYYYLLRLNEKNKWKIETAVSINEKERIEHLTAK